MTERTRRKAEQARVVESETHVAASIMRNNDHSEVVKDEAATLAVHKFVTEPAYVGVKAGMTKSIGDYESLRVDVSISVPCYREQIDEQFTEVADMVADRLESEIDSYLG